MKKVPQELDSSSGTFLDSPGRIQADALADCDSAASERMKL